VSIIVNESNFSNIFSDFPEFEERESNLVELKAWKKKLIRNQDEEIKAKSLVNAELILSNDSNLKNTIGYNDFDGSIYLMNNSPWINRKAGRWEDSFEDALRSYIEENYRVLFESSLLHSAVINIAKKNVFNPVKERIEKVNWDGEPRIENFFIDLLGADNNEYVKEVTKRWIVGSVARIYQPGVKFEIVPMLEGKQGIGKSTAPRLLYGDEYFSDSLESLGQKKDDYMQLQGNVIMEIAELTSMKKTELTKVKSFISAIYDDFRPPYGRNSIKWPRRCVFIGTTNDSEYLKDITGERRFYPIPCKNEPVKNIFKVGEDYFLQVLAEAKMLYDNKQMIHFDSVNDEEILKVAAEYQEHAKNEDPVKEQIETYLSIEIPDTWDKASNSLKYRYFSDYPCSKDTDYIMEKFEPFKRFIKMEKVQTSEIMEVVFNKSKDEYLRGRTDSEAKKIALTVGNMEGWEKDKVTISGQRLNGYKNKNNEKENRKN